MVEGRAVAMAKNILDGSLQIGLSKPELATKIMDIISSDLPDNETILRFLHEEIGLLARTMRLANSDLYSLPGQVETLEKAIMILGDDAVSELLISAAMETSFDTEKDPSILKNIREINTHCLTVARASELLCRFANLYHMRSEAYTAGLLHDIGLVVHIWEGRDDADLPLRIGEEQNERDPMDYEHIRMGVEVAKAWHLPESIVSVMRYHHHPVLAQNNQLLVGVVFLAELLVTSTPADIPQDLAQWPTLGRVLQRLRIGQDEWMPLMFTIQTKLLNE